MNYRCALTEYAAYVTSGEWPGYPPGINRVALPSWVFRNGAGQRRRERDLTL